MKPLFWTVRCQSKSINEQFTKYNARLFDLRVRATDDGRLEFAHGLATFKGNVFETIEELNELAKSVNERVYVRVFLESNRKMKYQSWQDNIFAGFCKYIHKTYTNLAFFGGSRKYDGEQIYNFGTVYPTLEGKYSSDDSTKLNDLWPWIYAKMHNKESYRKGTEKDVLFLDFIEVK